MPQIRLSLLKSAAVLSTRSCSTLFIDVDDLSEAQERARLLIDTFYPQGVVIETSIPPTVLTVRMTGLQEVVDPEDQLWEDLKSAVAGKPLVL